MPRYNLMDYSNNYSKTPGWLWQYYKHEPNNNLRDSESYKSKMKIRGNTPAYDNTKDVEIIVQLKYLSNFRTNLVMPLFNYAVNLILTWLSTYVITNSTGRGRFKVVDTKLYVFY